MIKLFNLYFEYSNQRKHLLKCIVLLLHGVTLVKLLTGFTFNASTHTNYLTYLVKEHSSVLN